MFIYDSRGLFRDDHGVYPVTKKPTSLDRGNIHGFICSCHFDFSVFRDPHLPHYQCLSLLFLFSTSIEGPVLSSNLGHYTFLVGEGGDCENERREEVG
jgi:hypothetical protein